jgi:hypothetical protein
MTTKEKLNLVDELTVEVDCPWCENGVTHFKETRIKHSAMPLHVKNHAYTKLNQGTRDEETIGANCDCPRETVKKTRPCTRCRETGVLKVKLRVGQMVKVKPFWADQPETEAQIVELREKSSLPVLITWDLTDRGNVKKQAEFFAIMLHELDLS